MTNMDTLSDFEREAQLTSDKVRHRMRRHRINSRPRALGDVRVNVKDTAQQGKMAKIVTKNIVCRKVLS